jgi:hypothetical protein
MAASPLLGGKTPLPSIQQSIRKEKEAKEENDELNDAADAMEAQVSLSLSLSLSLSITLHLPFNLYLVTIVTHTPSHPLTHAPCSSTPSPHHLGGIHRRRLEKPRAESGREKKGQHGGCGGRTG